MIDDEDWSKCILVKWQASIKKNQKRYHIGYYFDEDEAAKAYENYAKKFFGEFACLNFPEDL